MPKNCPTCARIGSSALDLVNHCLVHVDLESAPDVFLYANRPCKSPHAGDTDPIVGPDVDACALTQKPEATNATFSEAFRTQFHDHLDDTLA